VGWGVCLDACVLLPAGLRDDLLSVASTRIYRPVWSESILREVTKPLPEPPRNLTLEQIVHLLEQLRTAFPTAEYSEAECAPFLPAVPPEVDAKDHHVVASALKGECKIIVTANVRDFARDILPERINIEVKTPASFLVDQWTMDPARVATGVRRQIARLERTPEEHVGAVTKRMPFYGELLAREIELLREPTGTAP
jgi:PIN domain